MFFNIMKCLTKKKRRRKTTNRGLDGLRYDLAPNLNKKLEKPCVSTLENIIQKQIIYINKN